MHKLLILCLIALSACAGDISPPKIATTRFCDTTASYIASIINNSYDALKVKYVVYVDTNNNKQIDWFEPSIYSSPILSIDRYETKVGEPFPIPPQWNQYTLITVMESTGGTRSQDKLHPCERHIKKPLF